MASKTTEDHKRKAPKSVRIGVLTISDSKYRFHWTGEKGPETEDVSGKSLSARVKKEGHALAFYCIVPDHAGMIIETVDHMSVTYAPDAIIATGGTGIGPRDVTIETLEGFFEKKIDGFGELFRMESIKEVGNAAMLSRASAGVYNGVVIFCLPGSPNACRTGSDLIFKEIRHIIKHSKE